MKRIFATIDGQDLQVDHSQEAPANIIEVEPGVYSVLEGGRSVSVRIYPRARSGWNVEIGGRTMEVDIRDPRQCSSRNGASSVAGKQSVNAPMPGKVIRLLVEVGDIVEAGQGLIVVEAMKMQNEMKSPKAGTVAQVLTQAGATVAVGDALIVIE